MQPTSPHPRRVILGPQGTIVTLGHELDALNDPGPLALINAGWQDREPVVEELVAACGGRPLHNLQLYARWEAVMRADPALGEAHRRRQDKLRQLQELYRRRLACTMEAARAMWNQSGPPELIDPERSSAIAAVQALDRHHLERVRAVNREFEEEVSPEEHPHLRHHRKEVAELLGTCATVLIAGGHLLVLLNRLRLFDLRRHLAKRTIVAWSAGAMALCERVVLFHDHPPQGEGDAEVLDKGLGLLPQVVLLPHASTRLRLDDQGRVGRFAQRFHPARCLTLDGGSRITYDGTHWIGGQNVDALTDEGTLQGVEGW